MADTTITANVTTDGSTSTSTSGYSVVVSNHVNNSAVSANVMSSGSEITANIETTTSAVEASVIAGGKGDTGDTGPKGDTGDAATITVGTVTTVAPAKPATVTNSGTSGAAVLDFEIPQGETGSVTAHDHDADYADITHTHDDRYYTETETDSLLTGKAASSHTHPTTDLTATGGTSTSFLRKDNTWATPTNTTYSEISEAEITAGTASTSRAISGRRAGFIRTSTLASSYPVGSIYIANTSSLPSSINAIGTWVQTYANSGTIAVAIGGFSSPLAYTVEPRYEWKRTA